MNINISEMKNIIGTITPKKLEDLIYILFRDLNHSTVHAKIKSNVNVY